MKKILVISFLLALVIFACKKSDNNSNNNSNVTPTACFKPEYSQIGLQVYDTFTNCSTNATSYSWDFGDSSQTSTATNPSHIYNNPGTYTVKLTASNGSNSQTVSMPVTVSTAYNTPISCGTADPSSIKLGDTVQCSAYCSQYATSYTWQDITVNGPVYNGDSARIPMLTGGTHTIVLKVVNSGNGKSATSNHTVVVTN